MGASGSSEVKVDFSRPNLFYFASEQVTGNLSFQNAQDKLTLDGIFLEFIGEMGYTTDEIRQYYDTNGNSRTENYTQNHAIPFISIRIPVVQPQYGQREITLYRGQYSWPFEFILPHCLPPSLLPTTISFPYVKYYARVLLDKSWFKQNTKVFPLTIFPRVNIFHVPGGQHPVAFQNQNRKKIRLQGYLIRGGVVPGDKLSIQIDLQNPKQAGIKRIEATLIQHRQVARSSHAETIFRLDLPDIREFTGRELQRTFDLIVPAVYLSPTYTYLSQISNAPIGMSIRYELILDIKVRGLFTDFKISVPVIVGTEPMTVEHQQQQQQQQEMNRPIEMPIASAPAFEHDESPPSYESIVTTQKT